MSIDYYTPEPEPAQLDIEVESLKAEAASLRAENERLRAALTPSAETKAAYIGEFHFTEESYDEDGQVYYRKVAVPWTIIKEIMAAISARAALARAALAAQPAPGKEGENE